MEIKVKPKALESELIATKVEDDMKKMKECVPIGQAADEEITKEQETMTTMEEGLRQNSDETKQDLSKSDSRSSSLERIKKLENGKLPIFCSFSLSFILVSLIHTWNKVIYISKF